MSQELRAALELSLGAGYRIERELGGGGMSRVFVAEDIRLRRRVAIKVLAPELTHGFSIQRFEREIQTAAGLQQANIVGVLSAGDADGLPFYIMPFVDGESLRAHLANGPLGIGETVGILRDVAKALAYAHRKGVVHRDIKPDNVLLSAGTAVVTDFGIAKAISAARTQADSGLTQAGMSIGTPAYMAPEQAAGDPNVDHRADLYSFGAMAYELLTGRAVFPDRTPQRALAAHLGEEPADVASLRNDIPPALAALVMRLLRKDPDARVQTAQEVVQQLDGVLSTSQSAIAPVTQAGHSVSFGKAFSVYLATFVAVVALAKLAVNTLGVSDWVLPGAIAVMALGLPLVLWTGYVRRVATAAPTLTPGGTRVLPQGTMATLAMRAAPQTSWKRTGKGGVFAFAGFIALVVGAATLRALGIGPEGSLIAANKLAANDKVVLADFVVSGADTSLQAALTTALRMQLEQSSVVQIVPQSSVTAALQRMRVAGEARVSEKVAREVAEREGAKAVIAADAIPLGGGYLITLRLVDARSGDLLASYAQNSAKSDDLLNAIDAAARKLRGRMGESLKALRAAPSLEMVTTSSLEALRKYALAGEMGSGRGDYRQSVKLLEEATALDSTFALAWRRLSLDYTNARMPLSLARRAAENAYRYRERLPPVERALVAGRYFGSGMHQNREKATENYAEALRLDSVSLNAKSAANQLGGIAQSKRDFRVAERFARIQTASGPVGQSVGYSGLVYALLGQDRIESALSALDTMRTKFPNSPTLVEVVAGLLSKRRAYDSIPAVIAPYLAASNPATRQNALTIAAIAATLGGQFRSALAYRDSIDAIAGPISREDSVALLIEQIGVRISLQREPEVVQRLLDSLSSAAFLAPIPVALRRYYEYVQLYARSGQLAKAKALLIRADAVVTDEEARYFYQSSRHNALAEVALVERKYSEALAEFRAADRLPDGPANSCDVCRHANLARVFDAAGQRDSATAEFKAYHGSGGIISRSFDASALAGSYKRLGELYEEKGDIKRAVEQYDKFVALWKNADPELQPIVRDVRNRITALTPVEPRR